MNPAAEGSALLAAHGLTRSFGTELAVAGLDLEVRAGEIHALVGLNGAGKTTLMRLLLGMLRPDAGWAAIRLPDRAVVGASAVVPVEPGPWVPVRQAPASTWTGVGHLIETPFAYAELTVTQTIRSAARLRGLASDAADAATARVIGELALEHWARRRARTLSLGNRQRLGLACALVHSPTLLVLDEPSNGLDPAGVLRVRRDLRECARRGAGILVSSHHLDEMARIADLITVLHRGRVVGTLAPSGVDLERQFFAMVSAADGVDAGSDPDDLPDRSRVGP
ncbi:MAG: ABC transporter ATP-binding protein [Cellulomonas sp.]